MNLWRWCVGLFVKQPVDAGPAEDQFYEPQHRRELDASARNAERAHEARLAPGSGPLPY
jgi:hypothetical protein